jgi:hypothetical protein
MRDIVHNYDQVVFGSDIRALMYAYLNQMPLFYSSINKPKPFEFFDPSFSFSGIDNINKVFLKEEETNFGMKKADLWERISLVHGYDGLMPLANNVSSARIEDDLLKITTKNSRLIRIRFNHMFLFDENVEGLPQDIKICNEGIVYDYFKFDSLHEYKKMLIQTDEDFVNQIWIDGNQGVVITKTEDLLSDIPDYAIRFRILELAKEYGIKGRQNGIYHYKKELKIPRFKKLDIKIQSRELCKTKMNDYQTKDNLTFISNSDILENQLLNNLQKNTTWNQLSR